MSSLCLFPILPDGHSDTRKDGHSCSVGQRRRVSEDCLVLLWLTSDPAAFETKQDKHTQGERRDKPS